MLIILLCFLPTLCLGHYTDTTCISARWIALKNNDINHGIFGQDSILVDSMDIVNVIRKLVEAKKINLYHSSGAPGDTKELSIFNHLDIVDWYNSEVDSLFQSDPFFEISVQSDYPMVDEYGDPVIVTFPDGTQAFQYPPPHISRYTSGECQEIRIKEKYVSDLDHISSKFEPVAISFVVRGTHLFWVDLQELWSQLDQNSNYVWMNMIKKQEYQGFQYMQRSCYD
jgi:hypothetical protein